MKFQASTVYQSGRARGSSRRSLVRSGAVMWSCSAAIVSQWLVFPDCRKPRPDNGRKQIQTQFIHVLLSHCLSQQVCGGMRVNACLRHDGLMLARVFVASSISQLRLSGVLQGRHGQHSCCNRRLASLSFHGGVRKSSSKCACGGCMQRRRVGKYSRDYSR